MNLYINKLSGRFRDFQILRKAYFFRQIFEIFSIHTRCELPQKLGPIGSAVFTFIGYRQTNKQTPRLCLFWILQRQAKYIYIEKANLLYSERKYGMSN